MSLLRSRVVRRVIPPETVGALLDALPTALLTVADEHATGRQVQLGLAARATAARAAHVQRRLAHQVNDSPQARETLVMANLRPVYLCMRKWTEQAMMSTMPAVGPGRVRR